MGTMELIPASPSMEASSPIDIRNLGPVVHAAQMQFQRLIKSNQALQKQFDLTVEANAAWRERERRREDKYASIEQDRQVQRENLAEHSMRVADHRAARYEAANRHEDAMRAAAQAKVQAVEDRLVRFAEERADHAAAERQRIAALEAKRDATYRQNLQLLEERRQAILAKEQKVEDMLRQRDELRQLQARIKAEEDFLREQQRRAIKARAEGDLAERVAQFHAKSAAKDEVSARRKKEIEDGRRMRADELRQRFEYIAAQASEAAAAAEAERQALAGKLDDKAARCDTLAAYRAALLDEMQNLRHQMQRQEDYLRSSLLRMRQQGSVVLPEEVVRSLENVQLGGPLMATAVLGSGRVQPLLLEGVPEERDAASAAGSGLTTPKLLRTRQGRIRRPKSAGPTPRGIRGLSPANGGRYSSRAHLSGVISPRAGRTAGKGRRTTGDARPASASAVDHHTPDTATASPSTPTSAGNARGSGPSPYASYAMPTVRPRGRKPSLEEEVAAAVDTSEAAEVAEAEGRYTGVHQVARPGSRREEELRVVLQEEIAKESERQSILAKVTDDDERERLLKFFTLEREEARRRILALSSAAQAALYH